MIGNKIQDIKNVRAIINNHGGNATLAGAKAAVETLWARYGIHSDWEAGTTPDPKPVQPSNTVVEKIDFPWVVGTRSEKGWTDTLGRFASRHSATLVATTLLSTLNGDFEVFVRFDTGSVS